MLIQIAARRMRIPLKNKQSYTKPLCGSFDMENSLLAGTGPTGGGGDSKTGEGFGQDSNAPAKDFDFSQEGGAWEDAKGYDSSLFDD